MPRRDNSQCGANPTTGLPTVALQSYRVCVRSAYGPLRLISVSDVRRSSQRSRPIRAFRVTSATTRSNVIGSAGAEVRCPKTDSSVRRRARSASHDKAAGNGVRRNVVRAHLPADSCGYSSNDAGRRARCPRRSKNWWTASRTFPASSPRKELTASSAFSGSIAGCVSTRRTATRRNAGSLIPEQGAQVQQFFRAVRDTSVEECLALARGKPLGDDAVDHSRPLLARGSSEPDYSVNASITDIAPWIFG